MEALVSPEKRAEWKINRQEFILELQEKYNVIELNEITDIKRHYCYEWTIKEDNHFIEGMLDNTLNCVCIETDSIGLCCSFALWVRTFMPDNADIMLYDEDFINHIYLKKDTDIGKLIEVFSK